MVTIETKQLTLENLERNFGAELFNIKRDNYLIAKGTHFWCYGCFVAQPVEAQSANMKFCRDCDNRMKREKVVYAKEKWETEQSVKPLEGLPDAPDPVKKAVTKGKMRKVSGAVVRRLYLSVTNCEVCGKEFPAKRKDAKFCSSGCRVKAHREAKK